MCQALEQNTVVPLLTYSLLFRTAHKLMYNYNCEKWFEEVVPGALRVNNRMMEF